jgi:glycosyltransferase involved in cell wall biosynthesis
MRVTLVISSFGAGGAERVMAVMANHWAEHGREVTLITLASAREDFYPLHPCIDRIGLEATGGSSNVIAAAWNNLQRLKRLRQEIRASRPDFVLSFIDTTNVLTLAATLGLRVPVIVSEHTDPRQHTIGFIWKGLRQLLYRRATAIVVLTEGIRSWAEQFGHRHRVHVIPNPVSVPAEECSDSQDRIHPGGTIAAIGRLTPLKGFDFLLKAFARCARRHSEWSLVILGEGEERGRLEALTIQLGIKDRVKMPGLTPNPFKLLRGADLFILSSHYEGFPMALLEAMACGLAVIAADCPSGPREIIRDGIDGVLVRPGNVDSLAAAMDRLMADRSVRQGLGKRAIEVVERFSTEKVMKMWDELFSNISSGSTMANSFMQYVEDRQTERRL